MAEAYSTVVMCKLPIETGQEAKNIEPARSEAKKIKSQSLSLEQEEAKQ